MCSTHRNDGSWVFCCVMGCTLPNKCFNESCYGKCSGQWAGSDVTIISPGYEIKMEDWGEFIPYDEEAKLREMALSLAAQLKWELSEEQWPASIYEVLDKVRKM